MSNREITRTIPANDHSDFGAQGDFIYLHTANLPLKVNVNGSVLTMRQGDKRRIEGGYPHFSVDNENGAAVTCTFVVGKGDYNRQAVTGSVSVETPTSIETTADVSMVATATTEVKGVNTARSEIMITNLKANTQTMRVGDINAGAARGQPLEPGQTLTLNTTAAVHAYNPGASAESVTVLEVVT